MRKLVSIQKVNNITPIQGADNIVLATVGNWNVIMKKSETNIGDSVVYFEIDSFIPESQPIAFLESKFTYYNGIRGMHIRAMKMRGVVSYGLALPISVLNGLDVDMDNLDKSLGVVKKLDADEQKESASRGQGSFPVELWPKTDLQRVQNIPNLVELLDTLYTVTTKLDGSSCSVFYIPPTSKHYKKYKEKQDKRKLKNATWWQKLMYRAKQLCSKNQNIVLLCSKNVWLEGEGNTNFHKATKELREHMKASDYPYAYVNQGEVLATDIQGNFENVEEPTFRVFGGGIVETQEKFKSFCCTSTAEYILKSVPIVSEFTSLREFLGPGEFNTNEAIIKRLLELAEGDKMNGGDGGREGIVFKPYDPEGVAFKVVAESYLLNKKG